METCLACSMPLDNEQLIGAKTPDGLACIHCVDQNKQVKSCSEIFEGGIQYFLSVIPTMDRPTAEKVVRKNMNTLPYWQKHRDAILEGPVVTDQEFQAILSQL